MSLKMLSIKPAPLSAPTRLPRRSALVCKAEGGLVKALPVRRNGPWLVACTRGCLRSTGSLPAQAQAKGLAWAVDRATAGKGALLTAAGLYAALAMAAGSADLANGQEVFDGNCAACHTGGLNSVQVEKTLSKESLVKYLDGGFNIDAIVHQVENGKNAMPAWADRLDADEIANVAAYVYNQADTNGW